MDFQQIVVFEINKDIACLNLTVIDDILSEGVEDFYATITSVPSGVDINIDTTIISIMDDESKSLKQD